MRFHFDVNPVSASRPRVGRWGTYYTGPYKRFKEKDAPPAIKAALPKGYKKFGKGKNLTVTVLFTVKRPKATKLEEPQPDIDNYLKAWFDACNGRVWTDDRWIKKVVALKQWAAKGRPGRIDMEVDLYVQA